MVPNIERNLEKPVLTFNDKQIKRFTSTLLKESQLAVLNPALELLGTWGLGWDARTLSMGYN